MCRGDREEGPEKIPEYTTLQRALCWLGGIDLYELLAQRQVGYLMHQSIETPAPRPPGHITEFNIYAVLKDGLFPRPQGQETC